MSRGNPILRKVQKLGASSLIVTLPREWARRHKVGVGEIVYVYDEGSRLVISPRGDVKPASLSFKLSSSSLVKHLGKLCACSYLFGFDSISFLSPSPLKESIINRISAALKEVGGGKVNVVNHYEVVVEYENPEEGPMAILSDLGRHIGTLFGMLARDLESGNFDLKAYKKVHGEASKLGFKLLRSTSTWKPSGVIDDRLNRMVHSIASVMGLLADAAYKLALELSELHSSLERHEVERLSLLLQILEVAVSTIASSADPPSIKKAEEAYWKIRQILELEGNLADVIKSGTPAFAYLLGKIIDAARLAEVAELALLCNSLVRKYSDTEIPALSGNNRGKQ